MNATDTNKRPLPELLAPAGSLEAFHAAVEAGANAVYLGIDRFNARLRAKNFSLKTLSYLVPYAHSRNVRVHVALNTLIKQTELPLLVDTLHALSQIGPDALIVQDLGAAQIAAHYFPSLTLHASTQMMVHDSAGVQALDTFGFKRAILARELTVDELRKITKLSPIELEVFVHGAICYSFSGLCLASSYLGGASGNRGQCTQVCRRRFENEGHGGFFFSPRDFSAIRHLPALADMGIASLKIEGRMKSAEYVYDVVSTYRTALANLDNIDILDECAKSLENDLGREKTDFFLGGVENAKGIMHASRPSGTGIEIGNVQSVKESSLTISEPRYALLPGDRIRLHGADGEEGQTTKVVEVSGEKVPESITVSDISFVKQNDSIFLVSRKHPKRSLWEKAQMDVKPVRYQDRSPESMQILRKYGKPLFEERKSSIPPGLLVRIDDAEWFSLIDLKKFSRIIVKLPREELLKCAANPALKQFFGAKTIVNLPPFIPEGDVSAWTDAIKKLSSQGITEWMISQFGHRRLLPKTAIVHADQSVWALNTAAQQALAEGGIKYFVNSFEDDYLNLKAAAAPRAILPVFAFVPLFISRIHFAVKKGSRVTDNRGNSFFADVSDGLFYTVGEQPLCLTHRIGKMQDHGVKCFLIDLSFCSADAGALKGVMTAAKEGTKMTGTSMFNHKMGLK